MMGFVGDLFHGGLPNLLSGVGALGGSQLMVFNGVPKARGNTGCHGLCANATRLPLSPTGWIRGMFMFPLQIRAAEKPLRLP